MLSACPQGNAGLSMFLACMHKTLQEINLDHHCITRWVLHWPFALTATTAHRKKVHSVCCSCKECKVPVGVAAWQRCIVDKHISRVTPFCLTCTALVPCACNAPSVCMCSIRLHVQYTLCLDVQDTGTKKLGCACQVLNAHFCQDGLSGPRVFGWSSCSVVLCGHRGKANIDRPVLSVWEEACEAQAAEEEVHLVSEFKERLQFNLQQVGVQLQHLNHISISRFRVYIQVTGL